MDTSPSYPEDLWFVVIVVQRTIQAFVSQVEVWKNAKWILIVNIIITLMN